MFLGPFKFEVRVVAEEEYISSLNGYALVGNSEFRSAEHLPLAVYFERLAMVFEYHGIFIDFSYGQFMAIDVKNVSSLKVFRYNARPTLASIAYPHIH